MRKVAVGLVLILSGFFRWLTPRACRFHPSCSGYSIEAFRKFNFTKALGLTVERLLRCHPFSKGGYDPVADKAAQGN